MLPEQQSYRASDRGDHPLEPPLHLDGDLLHRGIVHDPRHRRRIERGDHRPVPFFIHNHVAGEQETNFFLRLERFDGELLLDITCVGLRIDGQIVIGTSTAVDGSSYTFFALFVGIELPAGIPLGATGLGLFGMAGLFAIQMAPNKGAAPNVLHPQSRKDESWFENDDGTRRRG